MTRPAEAEAEFLANALIQVSRLQETRRLNEVLAALEELLVHMVGMQEFTISLRHPPSGQYETLIAHSDRGLPLPDPSPHFAAKNNFFGQPLAVIPLLGRERVPQGVVVCSGLVPHKPNLTARDQEYLALFARHGGIAAESALGLEAALCAPTVLPALREVLQPIAATQAGKGGLIVRAGETTLALSLSVVVEVCQMVNIKGQAPGAAPGCMGIIEYRGLLLPLFDVDACLRGKPARSVDALTDGFVVALKEESPVACAVDALCGFYEEGGHLEVPLPLMLQSGGVTHGVVLPEGGVIPLVSTVSRLLRGVSLDAVHAAIASVRVMGETRVP